MTPRIDAFCHILPRRYEQNRWQRFENSQFAEHSPSHLGYVRAGRKAELNYKMLTELEARFRMMEEFEGYRQVLSLASPPVEVVAPEESEQLAKIANDELAELVGKYPNYFAGAVASLPMNKPDLAARELERAIEELKLNGVQLFTNVQGRPLDSPEFRPIFQMMARYQLPILLHPARSRKHSDYATERDSKYLIWQVFGWPYETTAAMARLVFSGILDELPDLRIVVHHTGAMVPFFHGRMLAMYKLFEPLWVEERGGLLRKPLLDYFRSFYCDTATFTTASIECARDFFGADHILFGSDAPFDIEGGRFSIRAGTEAVMNSSLSAEEKNKVFYRNAQRLFGLAG